MDAPTAERQDYSECAMISAVLPWDRLCDWKRVSHTQSAGPSVSSARPLLPSATPGQALIPIASLRQSLHSKSMGSGLQ